MEMILQNLTLDNIIKSNKMSETKEPVYTFKSVEKEEKTGQQIEKEIIESAENNANNEADKAEADKIEADRIAAEEAAKLELEKKSDPELNDDLVLSYFEKKHGKKIESIEDLLTPREKKQILPEDISTYMKYKEETGRGMSDFLKVNEDIEGLSDDKKLARYYKLTKKGLDDSDIADIIEEEFAFDRELDDIADINKKIRAKKIEISKATEYLADQKSKYNAPLESKGLVSKEDQEGIEAYRKYIGESKTNQEAAKKKGDWFEKKTDEVFTTDFKGFDFNVGEDKSVTYLPSDINGTKETQKNIANFIGKFLDEDGMMKDAPGYHKALFMASNPEAMAKFFYEKGVADSVTDSAKSAKNTTLGEHKKPETISKGGVTVKAVGNNSGSGLKIKSKRTK
jgi:hypothetical protein